MRRALRILAALALVAAAVFAWARLLRGGPTGPVVRRQFSIEVGSRVTRVPGAQQAAMWVYRLEDPLP